MLPATTENYDTAKREICGELLANIQLLANTITYLNEKGGRLPDVTAFFDAYKQHMIYRRPAGRPAHAIAYIGSHKELNHRLETCVFGIKIAAVEVKLADQDKRKRPTGAVEQAVAGIGWDADAMDALHRAEDASQALERRVNLFQRIYASEISAEQDTYEYLTDQDVTNGVVDDLEDASLGKWKQEYVNAGPPGSSLRFETVSSRKLSRLANPLFKQLKLC